MIEATLNPSDPASAARHPLLFPPSTARLHISHTFHDTRSVPTDVIETSVLPVTLLLRLKSVCQGAERPCFLRIGGIATAHTVYLINILTLNLSLSGMLVLLLALAGGSYAHGGHTDKIPEGAAVSEDPIVCRIANLHAAQLLTCGLAGWYPLDTHPPHDHLLWHGLSCWHGVGGMSSILAAFETPV